MSSLTAPFVRCTVSELALPNITFRKTSPLSLNAILTDAFGLSLLINVALLYPMSVPHLILFIADDMPPTIFILAEPIALDGNVSMR